MDEYVLITGPSSGIGKALAYEFARHGNNLILAARRQAALKELSGEIIKQYHVKAVPVPVDLLKENAAEYLHDFCAENRLPVKILINNAGMGAQGNFMDIPLRMQEKIIGLNISAVVRMCSAFLPEMKKRRSGTIVNISSTTAFMPLANEAVYAASKAFILSFSQALYEEMKPFGVTVCTICPGVTRTDFLKRRILRWITSKEEIPRILQNSPIGASQGKNHYLFIVFLIEPYLSGQDCFQEEWCGRFQLNSADKYRTALGQAGSFFAPINRLNNYYYRKNQFNESGL